MNHATYNGLVNFIWGIADGVRRDVYGRGSCRDVVLPTTVIRRLDAVLEPTRETVIEMNKQVDGLANNHTPEEWNKDRQPTQEYLSLRLNLEPS